MLNHASSEAMSWLVLSGSVGYMKFIIRLKIEQIKGLLGFSVYRAGDGGG
jgi:hypothetical protein